MNRVRIVKRDYQKILKGLPQDHPPLINTENRYANHEAEQSPDEHRTICYTMGVYKEKPLSTNPIPSGKQLFKKHVLHERLACEESADVYLERQLKSYKRQPEDTKRIKTLQRSIELYHSNEQERSDKLRRKDLRAFSNPRRDSSKCSPYTKKLNRQSLNVSRDRTKTNLQSSNKMMRHHIVFDDQRMQDFKVGTMSEMKIIDRKGHSTRLKEEELLERGKAAYQENKFPQAIELFTQLLSRNPNNVQANYLMAVSLMGRNQFARAIRYLDAILKLQPTYNKNVFILYAISCKKLSLNDQSVKKLTNCIELFPDYYDAYIYRGKLKLKERKFAEAISDFVKANELNSEKSHGYVGLADCFYAMKEDQKAYEMFSHAFKIEPNLVNSPVCLKMVNCLKGIHRMDEAVSLLNEHIACQPNSHEALLLKGMVLSDQKKYNEAIMAFDQVLKLNDRKFNTKGLQQMIRSRICERDFYSAYHLIERIEFLDVDRNALEKIKMFTEAVLFLMKRKFNQSIEIFEQMSKKYKFILSKEQIAESDDIDYFLKPLYHLYSAYGYFCISEYIRSKNEYNEYQRILADRGKAAKILESSNYNKIVCQALINYEAKNYLQSVELLQKASEIFENKVEPYIYLGIIYVQLCSRQEKTNEQSHLLKALEMFTKGITVMGEVSNNTISNVYYHRSVVYSYMNIWNEAINDIDKAIEKSEDNIPKYFYLRGLAFACCQSFKQAIHDLSVCLTLNDSFAEGFLLRSKCLQIEGEANQAFVDLQKYITLKPEDPFIHKYAGHLLFENGAFEDSILAYAHGEIVPARDVDIFMTRGKAYFLLGEFSKAFEDMKTVWDITQSEPVKVDLDLIQLLAGMKEEKPRCFETAIVTLRQIIDTKICEGRIFKQKEYHMLLGGALLYSGQYKDAILQFSQCMILREGNSKGYADQEQQDADELEEVSAYLNHMRFNMALCYIMMADWNRAKDMCNKCTIQKEKTTLQLLLCAIKYQLGEPIETDEKEATLQVTELEIFSLKNKLSRHLKTLNPKFKLNPTLTIRPCFSFPKVEPPQITPQFDGNLLTSLDPSHIQNKPQAPWIRRAENSCIMFTSNIQVFDNLDLQTQQKTRRNDDESRQYPSAAELDNEFYKPSIDVGELSRSNIEKLKQKLKLEGDVEKKLNKLIKKKS